MNHKAPLKWQIQRPEYRRSMCTAIITPELDTLIRSFAFLPPTSHLFDSKCGYSRVFKFQILNVLSK